MFKLIKKKIFFAYSYVLIFQLVIIIAFMTFSFFYDNNGTMIMVILMLYPMVLPTVLLLNDTTYATLCCSLPVSRTDYVMGKYLGGFLFALILISIAMSYGYIITEYVVATPPIPFGQLYSLQGLSFLMLPPLVLLNSLTFPIYFTFTKEKGGIMLIGLFIVFLLTLIIGLVYAEKTLAPGIYYSKNYIFPVLMGR